MSLRDYQIAAIDAINTWDYSQGDPCVWLPTGAGKTVIFCNYLKQLWERREISNAVVLAHNIELVDQGQRTFSMVAPDIPSSRFGGAFKSRRLGAVTFATIQSAARSLHLFERSPLVIVDEAHRIPSKNEGQYRRLIGHLRQNTPDLKVIGFTATPFRLNGGPIFGEGGFFGGVCFKKPLMELINEGYLCPAVTKATTEVIDTSGLRSSSTGDFVVKELDNRARKQGKVKRAVAEGLDRAPDRRSALWFCVSIAHAEDVLAALLERGELAALLVGTDNHRDRAQVLGKFRIGTIRHLVSVNLFTEGFDAPCTDAVMILRPTASASLWVQMVGRGLRNSPETGKKDCLILDFGGNAERHGPIDLVMPKRKQPRKKGLLPSEPPGKTCPMCKEVVGAATMICPACDYPWPRVYAPKHEVRPSAAPVISGVVEGQVVEFHVERMSARIHTKMGSPSMMMMTYHCSEGSVSEPLCLEHQGGARIWAEKKWASLGGGLPAPSTVADAMRRAAELARPLAIGCVRKDGHWNVVRRIYAPSMVKA